jgi:hypothetical protein
MSQKKNKDGKPFPKKTKEHKENISKSLKGKGKTDEHKKSISVGMQKLWDEKKKLV